MLCCEGLMTWRSYFTITHLPSLRPAGCTEGRLTVTSQNHIPAKFNILPVAACVQRGFLSRVLSPLKENEDLLTNDQEKIIDSSQLKMFQIR